MAIIVSEKTVGNVLIIQADGDPSAGSGTPAPEGSLAVILDAPGLWQKVGQLDTDWYRISEQGETLVALFSSTAANVNNKFLDTDGIASSDTLPSVNPTTSTLTKLSFSNANATASCTLELRKNTTTGTPAASVSITTTAYTETVAMSMAVSAGDYLNCKVVSASTVTNPVVKLYS